MADAKEGEGSQAAERYAQAAFDLALESNALETLDRDFETLAAAFKASADLRAAAASPLIDPEEKSRAIAAVAKRLGLSQLGVNVAGAASRNGRAAELPQIAAAYRKRLSAHKGAARAEIVSAAPLSDAEFQSIVDALAGALGKKIEADRRVDESLIGGFIARVGSRQFDASLKSKLASLKLALKSA